MKYPSKLRVKINSASPEEIAKLHGIGKRRAADIEEYRKSHGFFAGPDDLAKVDGISLNLALSLTSQTDWELPAKAEVSNKRDWISAIFWFIICLVIALSILQIGLVIFVIPYSTLPGIGSGLRNVIITLGLAALVGFLIFSITRAYVAIISSKVKARQAARVGLVGLTLSLGSGFVIILSTLIYFQVYSPDGLAEIQGSNNLTFFLGGLACFALLLQFTAPQLIAWRRPDLISRRWLSRTFDLGIMLFGILLVSGFHSNILTMPWWLLILMGISGVIVLIIAIVALRRGESFFMASLDFIDPSTIAKHKATIDDWRMWINSRLPDPEQQRALKKTLDVMYQVSLTQLFAQILILGIGGWIVLAALDAIIELYVQQWWIGLFK